MSRKAEKQRIGRVRERMSKREGLNAVNEYYDNKAAEIKAEEEEIRAIDEYYRWLYEEEMQEDIFLDDEDLIDEEWYYGIKI